MRQMLIMQILTPVGSILAGILAGFGFEKVILGRLIHLLDKSGWDGGEVVVRALKGSVLLGFVIAGIYGASYGVGLNPTALGIIHKILQIMVIAIVTRIASRIVSGLLNIYMKQEAGFLPAASLLDNLAKALVYGLGILIALQALDISITPILTALGVGGLAVALALQDTLTNLFSGLYIIASRDIKLGEYIKLNSGEEGYVADISWRNTIMRALPNNLIVVPNAKLATAVITNYQQPDKAVSFGVGCSVSYQSNLDQVEQVALEVAKSILSTIPGGVADFEPFVRFQNFGAAGIEFSVGLRAGEFTDQFRLKHEFIKALYQRFAAEGIEIPYPTQNVLLKGES